MLTHSTLKGFCRKSLFHFLFITVFIFYSNPAKACLELPATPPDMNIETCNSFPQLDPFADYTILRLLNYSTYGANTNEFCACAINLPFQFGVVDSAAIVFSGTNTLVQGWDFSSDPDTGFGPSGAAWQGFSSAVSQTIPAGLEVDVVFIISAFCEDIIPSFQENICCEDEGFNLLNWFEFGDGLIGTDGANPDGSPLLNGVHSYVDTVGNIVVLNPSCFDGVINGDEEGNFLFFGDPQNCGGSECPPCETQFLELMDPCSCESTFIADVGFQDTLEISIIPGDSAVLEVNNGGFTDNAGTAIPVGTVFVDGGMFDDDGVVNGIIVVPFFRDEGESADIVVNGVSFLSPAPCPFLADCNMCDVEGGTLTGGPFEFCVGDGEADNIPAGSIGLSGNMGTNSQWVVTDDRHQ